MNSGHRNEDFERFAESVNAQEDHLSVAGGNKEETTQSNINQDFGKVMDTIAALMQQNAQMMSMLQQQVVNSSRTIAPEQSTSDVKNYNVMPDLSKTIGDFSRELGPGSAKAWLTNVETNSTTSQLAFSLYISNRMQSFGGSCKVMVANTDTTIGVSKKLIPKYRGPYQITAVLPNDRYVLSDIIGFQNSQMPYDGILEASRLKAYST